MPKVQPRPLRLGRRWSEALSGYLFLAPYLVVFLLFMVYPVLHGLWISFQEYSVIDGVSRWVGLENYIRMIRDPVFWKSLWNTLYFTLLSTPPLVVLGLALAIAIDRQFKLRSLFRVVFFAPYVLSVSVVGILWLWLLMPDYGLIDRVLTGLGFNTPNWLFDPRWAMPAVVLTTVWWTVGFNMIIFLAGLQDIPQSLYEAADVDGAGPWQKFWHITVPGLRRVTLFVVVRQVIASFQIFGQVFIMTGGGPYGSTRVLIQYVYEKAFRDYDMGYASSMAYTLFLIILVCTVLQFKLSREQGVD